MREKLNTRSNQIIEQYKGKYNFIKVVENEILNACEVIINSYRIGGKLLICGNGGSNSDADHIVGELLKGFLLKRPVSEAEFAEYKKFGIEGECLAKKLQGSLPSINLGAHTSLITAVINDIGGEEIYAQQVNGFGTNKDVLIGISTSGNSKNIIKTCIVAKVKGMKTIGFTGVSGGKMNDLFDIVIHAPSCATADIQDMHTTIYHLICAIIESEFWSE